MTGIAEQKAGISHQGFEVSEASKQQCSHRNGEAQRDSLELRIATISYLRRWFINKTSLIFL